MSENPEFPVPVPAAEDAKQVPVLDTTSTGVIGLQRLTPEVLYFLDEQGFFPNSKRDTERNCPNLGATSRLIGRMVLVRQRSKQLRTAIPLTGSCRPKLYSPWALPDIRYALRPHQGYDPAAAARFATFNRGACHRTRFSAFTAAARRTGRSAGYHSEAE
jgi:hypothetical protein